MFDSVKKLQRALNWNFDSLWVNLELQLGNEIVPRTRRGWANTLSESFINIGSCNLISRRKKKWNRIHDIVFDYSNRKWNTLSVQKKKWNRIHVIVFDYSNRKWNTLSVEKKKVNRKFKSEPGSNIGLEGYRFRTKKKSKSERGSEIVWRTSVLSYRKSVKKKVRSKLRNRFRLLTSKVEL